MCVPVLLPPSTFSTISFRIPQKSKNRRKDVESRIPHPSKINSFFSLFPNDRGKWFVTSLTVPRNGSIRIEEMASFQAHTRTEHNSRIVERKRKNRSESSRTDSPTKSWSNHSTRCQKRFGTCLGIGQGGRKGGKGGARSDPKMMAWEEYSLTMLKRRTYVGKSP